MARRDSVTLDEIDLKIINALQVQPRAPWRLVGACVGVDPATAARRWQRLADVGAAWISCFPRFEPTVISSIIELQCEPGRTVEIAEILAGDPHARTLQIQSGAFDIGIVTVAANHRHLARYVLERVSKLPGVQAVRTMPVTTSHRDITQWRLSVLDSVTVARLSAGADTAELRRSEVATDWDVISVLSTKPRISVEELATQLGVSPATARRRLEIAVRRQVELVCEVALPLSPWPIQVTFWGSCRAEKVEAVATQISQAPGVIAVFATLGSSNLDIAVRVSSIQHIARFEATLSYRLPDLQINDRLLVTRLVKFGGQMIDADGFGLRYVPIDIRLDPVDVHDGDDVDARPA